MKEDKRRKRKKNKRIFKREEKEEEERTDRIIVTYFPWKEEEIQKDNLKKNPFEKTNQNSFQIHSLNLNQTHIRCKFLKFPIEIGIVPVSELAESDLNIIVNSFYLHFSLLKCVYLVKKKKKRRKRKYKHIYELM